MGFKSFIWKIAVKKGAKALVSAVLAFLGATATQKVLSEIGVTIDLAVFEEALTVAIFGLIEFLRNTGKHKFGIKGL